MRYTLKKLMPSFITALIIIILSTLIYVGLNNSFIFNSSELTVTSHKMDVVVEEDGSIYIKEDVILELDSYWNYVIKDICFTKDEAVENDLGFQIDNAQSSFDENSFVAEVYSVNNNKLKASITRDYTFNQSKYRSYKITSNGNFVTGTRVHYEYRILNAVTVYNDIAELNWILIDENEYLTKNIEINISLPSSTDVDGILFYGHGVTRDNAFTQDNTSFTINIDKLYTDELIETRILFDKTSLTQVDSSKAISNNAKEAILSTESNIAAKQQELRNKYNQAKLICLVTLVIFIIVLVLYIRHIYIKYDKERKSEFDSSYYRELPSNYSPAELGMLLNFNELDKNELEATLLDLIRRKYIILDTNGCSTTDKKPNYKLILNKEKSTSDLLKHEKYLLEWFFDTIANGDELELDELDNYLKRESNAVRYLKYSKNWGEFVLKESLKHDFFDNVKEVRNKAWLVDLLALMVIIISIVCCGNYGYYKGVFYAGIALSIAVIISAYIYQIKRRSGKGNEDYVRWMAFKNFLLDFSTFDDYPMPSIVIWEHYLVYATEFGIADKVEEQMRLKFVSMNLKEDEYIRNQSSSYLQFHFSAYYFHRRMHATRMIARDTINQARAARASSRGSGGSGGFGGGRSFGGGGGGMRGGR